MVQAEETVPLAKALQRCAVYSGIPLSVLCRAVQELYECLPSMIQSGNVVDLEMLDVAEKGHVAPASEGRALSLMPRLEPPVSVTAPNELITLEPEVATPSEDLTLVPRWRPPPPSGFSLQWADESNSPPLGQVHWPMNVPLGSQLDFASLGSIQVTISHFPVTGEVH